MRCTLLLSLPLLALCALASMAHADGVLLLKDGRILERPEMERVEGGVKVQFENGEVLIPGDLIQDAILDGVPEFEPTNDKEREKLARGLVPFEGRWIKKAKLVALIQKRIAERKAEIEDIRHHQIWRYRWKEKTKHFRFEYTVPPHIFAYYRDLMEAYYKEFAKTWKIKQPKDLGALTVCFYTDMDKFLQIGGVRRGVLGYFRFVKPLELNFFYDRLDPAATEQIMYHEANHYLQLLLDPDFNMPHFPGEALAEYYGASRFDAKSKTIETGLVLESRLAEIKMDVIGGDMLSLEKMLTTDGMYQHYTWGWSLAHFLMSDKRYRKKFERFVKDLVSGKKVPQQPSSGTMSTVSMEDMYAHFKKTFRLEKAEDLKAFEEAWHAYVKDGLQFVTGRGLEAAASRAAGLGMPKKAKRLYKEAIEAGTQSALTFHRYGKLLQDDGSRDEAIGYLKKAVAKAPLEASFQATLGQALFRSGDKEEGRRLVKLALELDPDNPWLEFEVSSMLEDE